MARYELTEFEWKVIQPLLPNKPRGVPRVDDRRVLNGIFWGLRSGAPWRDLPERYGPGPMGRRGGYGGPTVEQMISVEIEAFRRAGYVGTPTTNWWVYRMGSSALGWS